MSRCRDSPGAIRRATRWTLWTLCRGRRRIARRERQRCQQRQRAHRPGGEGGRARTRMPPVHGPARSRCSAMACAPAFAPTAQVARQRGGCARPALADRKGSVMAEEEKVPMDHDETAGGPVAPLPERRDGETTEEWWARLTPAQRQALDDDSYFQWCHAERLAALREEREKGAGDPRVDPPVRPGGAVGGGQAIPLLRRPEGRSLARASRLVVEWGFGGGVRRARRPRDRLGRDRRRGCRRRPTANRA